ncbi:MAG: hypothetical protein KTR29_19725 [Rhodothermaceae bacterium]|nr:hypothetical protein [Rhodothermaceae bacterium]
MFIEPAKLPVIGTVDERYLSYNVEMVEVTGGRFWRPYNSAAEDAGRDDSQNLGETPVGRDPSLYEYRPPFDLSNPRLRMLAKALGPAYVRVSGTWANKTYVPAHYEAPPPTPPKGYGSVLTPEQWQGVIAFCEAVEGEIVTSFAIGDGVRDASGVWTPVQAQRLIDLTRALGSSIKAAEFFNEPNLAIMGGAPSTYTAQDYGRDFQIFSEFIRHAAPDIKIGGPGSVMEATGSWIPSDGRLPVIPTPQLLEASDNTSLDVFSYHHYGAHSIRCADETQISPDDVLSEQWLRRTDESLAFYNPLRNQYAPSTPIWLTETAETACGGNPLANTFADTFRYLDQLGRLAKQQVSAVMHNTLLASDYSLIDEPTLTPKPNYWASLLWKQLMGTTVYDCGIEIQEGLHLYAHSLPGVQGGVTLLLINNHPSKRTPLDLPSGGNRYTLSADTLQAKEVLLNRKTLRIKDDGVLPALTPEPFQAGRLKFEPVTITFLVIP